MMLKKSLTDLGKGIGGIVPLPFKEKSGSEKSFLAVVAELPCWKNDFINDFSDDTEALYATLFSIVEYSDMEELVRDGSYAELRVFAESSSISAIRQKELQQKVKFAGWKAENTIRELGIESFIDDFVAICLKDQKIEPYEYKLIYLISNCLDLSRAQVSEMLRTRRSKLQYRAILFFGHPWVSRLITILIILNALQLGLMTCSWFDPYKGKLFYRLDFAFICLFTVEVLCRIFAFRKDFFRESQNIFDFIVVAVSWIPSPVCRWASALRVFRAMLLLNRLSQLKSIMRSLMDALPSIGWVSVLLFIVYYVFAVLTTNLFGRDFAAFQSLERSLFSLFQLMTLESWPELLAPILRKYPYSWLVFIPFMILTSYIFLNLVIGIIVTSMHDISLKTKSTEMREIYEICDLKEQVNALSRQIAHIQDSLAPMEKKDGVTEAAQSPASTLNENQSRSEAKDE